MNRLPKIEPKTKFSMAVLATLALLLVLAVATRAQTCTPGTTLKTQGYLGGCSNVSVLWFTQTPTNQIDHFDLNTFAGRYTASASAKSFSIPTSCGTGGQVVITEVRTNGSTCSVQYSGNLPHNRPCDQCGTNGGGNGTTIVSSANFRGAVSRNSLASIFPDPGVTFTDQTAQAASLPLPTVLAGVTVEIEGQLCELVSVAPGQINFYLPAWLDPGPTEVAAIIRTTRGSVGQFFGRPQLNPSAPGIFTLSSNGTGAAAANWLIVKPNGLQIWQNPGALSYNSQDRIFLVLYGTGINEVYANLFINGTSYASAYTGNTWMAGVQQLVFEIPKTDLPNWPSTSGAFVRVGVPGRSWDSQGFDVRK